ncbi:MAG: MEDS domain-containing protein [Candidatus Dormiibacterota bacterium]
MASSRIAENLKSARERMGWSREALAYHSGLSWSAIAQIESGRRQEIRVSSLVALASALGVSVDYLVGGAATVSPRLLGHKAFIYSSDDEFLASAVPFLAEGIERSEAVLAVPAAWQLDLLRDALGDAAHHVEFLESAEWYESLRGASRGYLDFVRDRFVNGASWIRILGEATWLGRAEAPAAEWFRYESMINISLASAPATIVCTYDARSLSDDVLMDARRTHPEVLAADQVATSLEYQPPEDFILTLG